MKFSVQDKIVFGLTPLWLWVWGFIMLIDGYSDFTLRQVAVLLGVPAVVWWMTGTMGRVSARFRRE